MDYPRRYMEKKGAERKESASLCVAAGASQRDARPIVIGTPDLIRKRSAKWWDTVPEGHITVEIRPSQALSDLLVEEFKKGL